MSSKPRVTGGRPITQTEAVVNNICNQKNIIIIIIYYGFIKLGYLIHIVLNWWLVYQFNKLQYNYEVLFWCANPDHTLDFALLYIGFLTQEVCMENYY